MAKSSSDRGFAYIMSTSMTHPVKAARRICAGLLPLAFLTVAWTGCGGSASDGPRASTAQASAHTADSRRSAEEAYADRVISRVQPRQLAAFALLRTPSEGLPSSTQRFLGRPIFGSNWRLAQRIPVKAEGAYWLVPGDRHLCVISQGVMGGIGVGATCEATAQAIAHGVADISMPLPGVKHRTRLIVGVAPAGTREVVVHTRGAISTAPVHHEVFILRDSTLAPPDTILLR
jgi:hypothetical protein